LFPRLQWFSEWSSRDLVVIFTEAPRGEFLQLGGLQLVFGLATDALNQDAGM
jgi:hypothetical protein